MTEKLGVKMALVGLLLTLATDATLGRSWISVPQKTACRSVLCDQLIHFYKGQNGIHREYVRQATAATEEATSTLGLENQADTILAIFHRESCFNPASKGLDDDEGIGQTMHHDRAKWYAFWQERGIHLGPFHEIRTQAYFGVAEFYEKLGCSGGDVKDAVRRYNGAGPAAQLYAERVMRSRRNIFKRPYHRGEKQTRVMLVLSSKRKGDRS